MKALGAVLALSLVAAVGSQEVDSSSLVGRKSVINQLKRVGVKSEDIRGMFLAIYEKQIFDMKSGVKFKTVLVGVQGGNIPEEWRKALSKSTGFAVTTDNPKPKWGTEVALRIGTTSIAKDGNFLIEAARFWGERQGVIEQFKLGKSAGKWKIWKQEEARRF